MSSQTQISSTPDDDRPTTQTKPWAVEAVEAARLCGIKRTLWYQLKAAGKLPRPLRLGRRTLWYVAELEEWVAAGCPPQSRWEQIRKERNRKLGRGDE